MLITWKRYSIKLQMVSAQEVRLGNDANTYLSSEDALSSGSVAFHLPLLHPPGYGVRLNCHALRGYDTSLHGHFSGGTYPRNPCMF